VARNSVRGWKLLGESEQVSMLGVSVSALPVQPPPANQPCCPASMSWEEKLTAAESIESSEEEQPAAKEAHTASIDIA
jgi:hypothetical protein